MYCSIYYPWWLCYVCMCVVMQITDNMWWFLHIPCKYTCCTRFYNYWRLWGCRVVERQHARCWCSGKELAPLNERHEHGFPQLLQEKPLFECFLLIPASVCTIEASWADMSRMLKNTTKGHWAAILLHEDMPVTCNNKTLNTYKWYFMSYKVTCEILPAGHHI